MKLSVTAIARNEANVIGRMLDSARDADELLVLDTGSTDNTVEVVEECGARVISVGERFMEQPTQADVDLFLERYGFTPSFTPDSKLFNYAAARNFAMSQAENDWCANFDADEVVEWNLDKVRPLMEMCDQLRYRFCYAHNPDGTPLLEFSHCKIFNRTKGTWVKKCHEVVENAPGSRMFYTDDIYLHHWQEANINRSNMLPKLEYAILEQPDDDRNTYYLAREYYYAGMRDTAIAMFEKYLELPGWKPERSEACIQMGQCHKWSGRKDEAIECYHRALREDQNRREPWYELGHTYAEWGRYREAIMYLRAAVEAPYNPDYYLNLMNLYGGQIWDELSMCYDKLGEYDKAQAAWLEAVKASPNDERILSNGKWFCRKSA